MDFFDVIVGFKKRPSMYIDPADLDSLVNFMRGYFHCKTIEGYEVSEREAQLETFYKWIAEKYGVNLVVGNEWMDCLKNESSHPENELEKFFQLWDEYFDSK